MANGLTEGQSFSNMSIGDCDFQSNYDAAALLDYDEAHFKSPPCSSFPCESLPSVFNDPLNCSDWTLRLSHVSLSPTSDSSNVEPRRIPLDEFILMRSHPLGSLDRNGAKDRPTFDMSFSTSPSVYYHSDTSLSDAQPNKVATISSAPDVSPALDRTLTPSSIANHNASVRCEKSPTSLSTPSHIFAGAGFGGRSKEAGCGDSRCYQLTNSFGLVDTLGLSDIEAANMSGNISEDEFCQLQVQKVIRDKIQQYIIPHPNRGSGDADKSDVELARHLVDRQPGGGFSNGQRHSGGKENVHPDAAGLVRGKPGNRRRKKSSKLQRISETFSDVSNSVEGIIPGKVVNNSMSDICTSSAKDQSLKSPPRRSLSTTQVKDVSSVNVETLMSSLAPSDLAVTLAGSSHIRHSLSALSILSDDSMESQSPEKEPQNRQFFADTGQHNTSRDAHSSPLHVSSTPVRDECNGVPAHFDAKSSEEMPSEIRLMIDAFTKPDLCGKQKVVENSSGQSGPVKKIVPKTDNQQKTAVCDMYSCDIMDAVKVDSVNRLSTGSLSDVMSCAGDLTYESTVRLSLPSHIDNNLPSHKGANLSSAATQTSMLSPRNKSVDDVCSPLLKGLATGSSSLTVIVPPELRIDGVCCVGLSSNGSLLIHNPSFRWLSVLLTVTHVSVNGRLVDQGTCPFVVRPKVTIDPNSTQSVKVIFAPRDAGAYVAQLSLSCGPVEQTLPVPGKMPVMVTLQAIAENPSVEILSSDANKNQLQFLPLPWGCETFDSITLVNRGHSTIPIRLVISSSVRNSFVFDRRQLPEIRGHRDPSGPGITSKLLMPLVHSCLLHGSDVDSSGYEHQIPVYFRAPRRSSSRYSGRAERITGTIVAEVDVPSNSTRVLASLDIVGTVGTAKLHLPRHIPPIEFVVGESRSQMVPLRNSGDISLAIELQFNDRPDMFSVSPRIVELDAGCETVLTVTFNHRREFSAHRYESLMSMHIKPDGPVYEVKITSQLMTRHSVSESHMSLTDMTQLTQVTPTISSTCRVHVSDLTSTFAESAVSGRQRLSSVDSGTLCSFDSSDTSMSKTLPAERTSGFGLTANCAVDKRPETRDDLCANKPQQRVKGVSEKGHQLEDNQRGNLHKNVNSDAGKWSTLLARPADCELWGLNPERVFLFLSRDVPALRRVMVISFVGYELRFEVSWPIEYLDVTPKQGVIPPNSSTLLTIIPSKAVYQNDIDLPWNGSVRVICSHQTKVCDVEIRDCSSSSQPKTRPPPKATVASKPPLPAPVTGKTSTVASELPNLVSVKVPVIASSTSEMSNQCLRFPMCHVGDTLEMFLEFSNISSHELKWTCLSVSPAYIKRDNQVSCSRLTYPIYWWPRDSGLLQPAETDRVRVCFCPREVGHHSQCWRVEFHAAGPDQQLKNLPVAHSLQVDVFGLVMSETTEGSNMNDKCSSTLVRTAVVPNSPPSLDTVKSLKLRSHDGLITVEPKKLVFAKSAKNETNVCKLELKNRDKCSVMVEFLAVSSPFHISVTSPELRSRHFLRVPVEFTPARVGEYRANLIIRSGRGDLFTVELYGVCDRDH